MNFLANHNWIVATNFFGTEFSVVERAFVFVGISMDRAVQPTAATFESSQSNLLATSGTAILLLLAIFVLSFRGITITLSYRTAEATATGCS